MEGMYLIYGAGKHGREFLEICRNKNVNNIILTDSNSDIFGIQIAGYTVIAPESISYNSISFAIITTGYNFYEEIKRLLLTKLPENKIAYMNDVLVLSDSDSLNLGSVVLKNEFVQPGIYITNDLFNYFDESSFNELDKFFYSEEHRVIHKYVHYFEYYDKFFSRFRGENVRLLEIGVSKGGSLQMWKNYFGEKAQIFGIDIEFDCKKLESDGIKIIIGDQEDKDFLHALKEEIGTVDIIIDDGGHTMLQQINSFEELFNMLSENGIYLCEDCQTSYWDYYNGGYKKEGTFIEYSKNLIDDIYFQYFTSNKIPSKYREEIKAITFCDGMTFIEKKKKTTKSIALMLP